MATLATLRIKLYTDSASPDDFRRFAPLPHIAGFTTNPSLMRKAGVSDYLAYMDEVLPLCQGKPVSFEVIADDLPEMRRQAMLLGRKGDNVFVKIPIMNTRGEDTCGLVRELCSEGVKVNVTALLALSQVERVAAAFPANAHAIVSVFGGRIADTGVDPMPIMRASKELIAGMPGVELLWASQRELLNVVQAEECGCDIITVQPATLDKLAMLGTDLVDLSRQTVVMFARDAAASGLSL